jgi:hypothetical protein
MLSDNLPFLSDLSKANIICRSLCQRYGIIKPPQIIPLLEIRRGEDVGIGHYNRLHNEIEINLYVIWRWLEKDIIEIIQHELAHVLCYQIYSGSYDGDHDDRFYDVCKRMGLPEYVVRPNIGEPVEDY